MKLYNTLTRTKEEFRRRKSKNVCMWTDSI